MFFSSNTTFNGMPPFDCMLSVFLSFFVAHLFQQTLSEYMVMMINKKEKKEKDKDKEKEEKKKQKTTTAIQNFLDP